jgi:hypothetical protein
MMSFALVPMENPEAVRLWKCILDPTERLDLSPLNSVMHRVQIVEWDNLGATIVCDAVR